MKASSVRHLFFDLDHTLWDYDYNSSQALKALYLEFDLEKIGFSPVDKFITVFHTANLKVWEQFDENFMNRHTLRNKRMELVFEHFGIEPLPLDGFQERYYQLCSTGKKLIDGCMEMLNNLAPHFTLHLITNGFEDALENKLVHSGLKDFFRTLTSSEKAGSKKPDSEYFSFALEMAGALRENALVIGDGLRTDVAGARNYGLPVVWFNPEKKPKPFEDLVEIHSLIQLPALLLNPLNHKPEFGFFDHTF